MARAHVGLIAAVLAGLACVATASPPRQSLPAPAAHQRVVLADGDVWLETSRTRRSLHLARYHPWKLAWARVAGQRQLAVGVHKKTRYQTQPHNALFLYDWNGGRISPRWLGSRLSRPFTDFAFADMRATGETELVSVEQRADGRFSLMVYRWTGFGFEGEWESQPYHRIGGLSTQGSAVTAQAWSGKTARTVRVGWRQGRYGELSDGRRAK